MMADGGIFIFNQHRYNNASHRTMILPAGRAYYGGTLPSDHTQTDGTGYEQRQTYNPLT